MDLDMSHLLEHWEYQAGQLAVRRFQGRDGKGKLQLRIDLGILQMNVEGRPDGKRPLGYSSLYEYYQARLYQHLATHEGSDTGFELKPEDCSRLQLEALQFHQRSFCLLQLDDFPGTIRDAERNLALLSFVGRHAGSEDLAWSLKQFQPQLLMVLTRARTGQALEVQDYSLAFQTIEEGMEQIRVFLRDHDRAQGPEHCPEVTSLEKWLEELRASRPLSRREKLERALSDAVKLEDYEKAAQVRDALRDLKED